MWVYIINILLILIYGIFIKDKKKLVIVCSIQCFLILALRSNALGPDMTYYKNGYNYISNYNFIDLIKCLRFIKSAALIWPYKYESGYVILNWIVSQFGFSYHFFLVVCAAINSAVFGKFIYKYSKIPWLSYVIFCTFGNFFYQFGIMRQSLALCFFLISFMYAMDNKKQKAIIFYIISFLFHRVSIVMLPLLFLINKRSIKKKNYFIILLLSIPFTFISKYLYAFAKNIASFLGSGGYASQDFKMNNLLILLYIISFVIFIFVNFKKQENNKIFNVLIWALLLTIYFDIMGQYNEVWERSVQMYITFLNILIPLVVFQYNKQKEVIFAKFAIVVLLFSYMIYILKDSILNPYRIQTEEIIFRNDN